MNKPVTYLLRWKGQQLGPYTADIIEQKLRDHELSLAHEIQVDGNWRSLRGFLNLQAESEESERQKNRLRRMQDELDAKQIALDGVRHELEEAKRQPVRLPVQQHSTPSFRDPSAPIYAQRPAEPQTSGFAVTGLVMGIVSMFCFGALIGILGIIFSAIARSNIRQNPEQFKGIGMANAGLTLSIIGTAVWLVWWIFWWGSFTALWTAVIKNMR